MACNLVGCMTKYRCGELKVPVVGTNLAPFVRLWVEGSDFDLTVGNQSDPTHGNTAVIKSFQYGASNGAGCNIEIMDEEGGNFESMMNRLNKKAGKADTDYKMKVQWGWINTECGSTTGNIVKRSQVFTFLPLHCEASYNDGKIKYQITGASLMEVVFEARQAIIYGSDDHKISLKEAIRMMFADGVPKVTSVKFLRVAADGTEQEWGFKQKDGGFNGPVQKWLSDQQNKLSAAMKWIEPFTTDRDKGIIPVWDDQHNQIIFYEDPAPKCNESMDWCNLTLGTYVVNAGSCSSVLRFTPTAKWVFGALSWSGGMTSKTSGANEQRDGREGCDMGEKGTGNQTSTPMSTAQIDQNGFKAHHEHMQAQAAHDSANKRVYSMEAEMVIQGDPDIAGSRNLFGRTVSVVVISPFHIEQTGTCGEWLASPGCHPVYSNKAWWVKGVDHNIKEGSYVTTLKLVLSAPGSDVNSEEPFGGLGSEGWTPEG